MLFFFYTVGSLCTHLTQNGIYAPSSFCLQLNAKVYYYWFHKKHCSAWGHFIMPGYIFLKEHKKCFSAVIVLWWMMPIAQVLFQQWNSLLKRRIIELVENKNVHDVYEIWSIALTLCNNNLLDTLFLFDLKNFPALARVIRVQLPCNCCTVPTILSSCAFTLRFNVRTDSTVGCYSLVINAVLHIVYWNFKKIKCFKILTHKSRLF